MNLSKFYRYSKKVVPNQSMYCDGAEKGITGDKKKSLLDENSRIIDFSDIAKIKL